MLISCLTQGQNIEFTKNIYYYYISVTSELLLEPVESLR